MVSVYDAFMAPLEKMGIKKARKCLLKEAKGNVLEIGAGTGVNLKFYNFEEIELMELSDIDFDKRLLDRAFKNGYKDKVNMKVMNTMDLPFEDNSFDYVVHTLVFCSVEDVNEGLSEIRRVLKPTGQLIFIEHILPERNPLRKIFNIFSPAWKKIASGCHLNRDFEVSLKANGFKVIQSHKFMLTAFVSGIAIIEKK